MPQLRGNEPILGLNRPFSHGSFGNSCGLRANSFSYKWVKDMLMSPQSYGDDSEGGSLLPQGLNLKFP
jgi:hypothetical protein